MTTIKGRPRLPGPVVNEPFAVHIPSEGRPCEALCRKRREWPLSDLAAGSAPRRTSTLLDDHAASKCYPAPVPWTDPSFKPHEKPVSLGNLRSHRIRTLLVYCGNPKCTHQARIQHFQWPDETTLSDFQPRMLCTVCEHLGADVRPDWDIHGKPGEQR